MSAHTTTSLEARMEATRVVARLYVFLPFGSHHTGVYGTIDKSARPMSRFQRDNDTDRFTEDTDVTSSRVRSNVTNSSATKEIHSNEVEQDDGLASLRKRMAGRK